MKLKLTDEPSKTEVCGLVLAVEYDRLENTPPTARWMATLRHPNLGAVSSHGPTPSQARQFARERVAEQLPSMMTGHAQKHAHEVS